MRKSTMRRVAISVAISLSAAAVVFAWIGGAPQSRQSTPAALPSSTSSAAPRQFAERCARCHEREEMTAWLRALPVTQRESELIRFLEAHQKATAPENLAITRELIEGLSTAE